MDPLEFVTVYEASNSVEAEIVRNALLDEGVKCFMAGENQAAGSGLAGIPVTIQVAAVDADRAREFIRAHEERREHMNDTDDMDDEDDMDE
jgi:Putative prokaryotic signal transducing protein